VEEEIMDAIPLQCSFGGTTWKTPELTASYFGASSRYEYSTSTPDTETPDQASFSGTDSKTTAVGNKATSVTEHIQRVLWEVVGGTQ
jgi:hypothetical protein